MYLKNQKKPPKQTNKKTKKTPQKNPQEVPLCQFMVSRIFATVNWSVLEHMLAEHTETLTC